MIYLDPANQGRTEIIRNDLNPVWNYKTTFAIYRRNVQIQINVKDADDLQDFTSMPNLDNITLPTDKLDKLPVSNKKPKLTKVNLTFYQFGIGNVISDKVDQAGGLGGLLGSFGGGGGAASGGSGSAFGGFMGTLGGFSDKLGGLNEKLHEAKESLPLAGLGNVSPLILNLNRD